MTYTVRPASLKPNRIEHYLQSLDNANLCTDREINFRVFRGFDWRSLFGTVSCDRDGPPVLMFGVGWECRTN